MTRASTVFIVCFGCFLAGTASGDPMLEIRSGLNALHTVQDNIARGVHDSSQFQEALLNRIVEGFESSPKSSLAEREYQLALAEFALSGGDRKRVRKLVGLIGHNSNLEPILSGADAYLAGQMDVAAKVFEEIDNSAHESDKIKHFRALAMGTALLDIDLGKARKAFEQAALLGPGTLVEEVSLRRLVRISIVQKDPELFVRCIALYFRRYANSPFAREIISGYVSGLAMVNDPGEITRLVNLAITLPGSSGPQLTVLAAAELLANGRIAHASKFVERLVNRKMDSGKDLSNRVQTRLLELLVDVKRPDTGEALPFLRDAEPALASSEIAPLSTMARHVFWNLHKPLIVDAGEPVTDGSGPVGDTNEFAKVDQILLRAKAAVGIENRTAAVEQ